MRPSIVLEQLGLGPEDRAVVFHVDDVGMCEATVSAFADLLADGWIRSGSLMAPCPWFPAAAELLKQFPAADPGVHLTLTSEWRAYRWSPLSDPDPSSGLTDADGYFHRRGEPAAAADAGAVHRELVAQISRVLRSGVDPTHVDSHMLTLADPRLLSIYLEAADAFDLFPVLWSPPNGPVGSHRPTVVESWSSPDGKSLPMLQDLVVLPRREALERKERLDLVLEICRGLPAGCSQLTFHPARDTPELRRLASDWQGRVADWRVLLEPTLRKRVAELGIHVLDYRQLAKARRDEQVSIP